MIFSLLFIPLYILHKFSISEINLWQKLLGIKKEKSIDANLFWPLIRLNIILKEKVKPEGKESFFSLIIIEVVT